MIFTMKIRLSSTQILAQFQFGNMQGVPLIVDLCSVEGIIVIGVDHICYNLQIVLLTMQYSIGICINPSAIISIKDLHYQFISRVV